MFNKYHLAFHWLFLLVIVLFLSFMPPDLVIDPNRVRLKFMVDEITAKSDKLWLEEQERRQDAVREVCVNYGLKAKRKLDPTRYVFIEKDNIMWCKNAKVRMKCFTI